MKSANKWQLRGSFQASSFDKGSDAFSVLFLDCGPFPIRPDESIYEPKGHPAQARPRKT